MGELLAEMMRMAVILRIEELKARGGPTDDDRKKAQETSDMLGEHGDELLFKSEKPGRTAELFNRTAHAIAVLSFCPGGVTLFGATFEANREHDATAGDEHLTPECQLRDQQTPGKEGDSIKE
jgi:hypothetical protein